MRAFGREVASRTVAGVFAGMILLVITAAVPAARSGVVNAVTFVMVRYNREGFAWSLVVVLAIVVTSLAVSLLRRPKAGFYALAPNSGVKPSVMLAHHGSPTTYYVDGRIIELLDGTQNPVPAMFRCELQVSGITGQWTALLNDGEWANIILGSIEPVYAPGPVGKQVVGHSLVIRRGKFGQHTRVPDTGAIVELIVHAKPKTSQPPKLRLFRVVRNGNLVNITEEPAG